jgi:hypothetical protein
MSRARTEANCHASILNEHNLRALEGDYSVDPIDVSEVFIARKDALAICDTCLVLLWIGCILMGGLLAYAAIRS